MNNEIEKEIEIINNIAFQFEMNGADAGGSYASNGESARESLEEWIKYNHLEEKYYVEYKWVTYKGYTCRRLQISERK